MKRKLWKESICPLSRPKNNINYVLIYTRTNFAASWLLRVSVFVGLALSLGTPILLLPIFLFFLFDCGVFILVSVATNYSISTATAQQTCVALVNLLYGRSSQHRMPMPITIRFRRSITVCRGNHLSVNNKEDADITYI